MFCIKDLVVFLVGYFVCDLVLYVIIGCVCDVVWCNILDWVMEYILMWFGCEVGWLVNKMFMLRYSGKVNVLFIVMISVFWNYKICEFNGFFYYISFRKCWLWLWIRYLFFCYILVWIFYWLVSLFYSWIILIYVLWFGLGYYVILCYRYV